MPPSSGVLIFVLLLLVFYISPAQAFGAGNIGKFLHDVGLPVLRYAEDNVSVHLQD